MPATPLVRTMAIVGFGLLMSALDMTVTNVAIRTLGQDLHGSLTAVQWVLSAYLLAVAAVLPVSGWVARRLGARRAYVVSIVLFTAGSALCALAGSMLELIGFRVIQGIGGGMILSTSQLIAAEAAGPDQMGHVMSRIWSVTALGTVLGPLFGGLLLDSLGWRWIFMINVPIGVIGTFATIRWLPETPARAAGRLDLAGLLLLGIGVPAVMFGLSEAGASGRLTSVGTLGPLLLGLALVAVFVGHALRSRRPLLNIRLYAQRAFASGSLSLCFLNVAWYALLLLAPLYLQQVRHDSAALAGLLVGVQGIGTAIGMAFAGRRSDGASRLWGFIGVVLFGVGTIPLALSGPHTSYWVIGSALLVEGFAGGLVWVPSTTAAYAELEPDEISHATPLVAVVTRLGGAVGTAIAAIVLQHQLSHSGLVMAYDITFWAVIGLSAIMLVPYTFVIGPRHFVSRPQLRWQRGGTTASASGRSIATAHAQPPSPTANDVLERLRQTPVTSASVPTKERHTLAGDVGG